MGELQIHFNFLWDSSRDSWLGFGVKLGRKHAYIIRRKAHGKPIIPTGRQFADFNDIKTAWGETAGVARPIVASV